MIKLPEEHELLWVFECEPEIKHAPDYGWAYNTLTFTMRRGDDELVFTMSPSYGNVEFHLKRSGIPVLDLVLCKVAGLVAKSENGQDWIELTFEDKMQAEPLVLRLKPSFHVAWECPQRFYWIKDK